MPEGLFGYETKTGECSKKDECIFLFVALSSPSFFVYTCYFAFLLLCVKLCTVQCTIVQKGLQYAFTFYVCVDYFNAF